MQPVLFLLYYSLFPGKSAVKALGRAYPGGPDSGGVRLPGNCSHRINLSCYGQDSGLGLWDAVEAVCGLPEVERVRLGSLEPEQMELPVLDAWPGRKSCAPSSIFLCKAAVTPH